jgi:GT2 family glycosyltransferase
MKICIAISSFKSDLQVISLLEELYSGDYSYDFVVVVCSSEADEIEAYLASQHHGNCFLYVSPDNLGSAGNLYRRFVESNAHGADYMLALNHDANISPVMFRELIACATLNKDVAAAYPLRYKVGKSAYDISGRDRYPFRMRGQKSKPLESLIPVYWGSSNGALYSLAPINHGLHPRAQLWMGWEDYLYGLDIHARGYAQYIVCSAETTDDYEYKDRLSGMVILTDKPSWYYYYTIRNFLQITCYLHPSLPNIARFPFWAIRFPFHALASKGWKSFPSSLKILTTGLVHGIFNIQGKWIHP